MLVLKTVVLTRKVYISDSRLGLRTWFVGLPLKSKELPLASISRIATRSSDPMTTTVIVISDRKTLMIKDLTTDMATYLVHRLRRELLAVCG